MHYNKETEQGTDPPFPKGEDGMHNPQTQTKTLPKTDVREMLWVLLKDRVLEDARAVSQRTVSYTRSNRVPGAGE